MTPFYEAFVDELRKLADEGPPKPQVSSVPMSEGQRRKTFAYLEGSEYERGKAAKDFQAAAAAPTEVNLAQAPSATPAVSAKPTSPVLNSGVPELGLGSGSTGSTVQKMPDKVPVPPYSVPAKPMKVKAPRGFKPRKR